MRRQSPTAKSAAFGCPASLDTDNVINRDISRFTGFSREERKMLRLSKAALVSSCLPLLLVGAALGGEGVEVKITNDGTEDIVVTVYDMNTSPERVVLTNTR